MLASRNIGLDFLRGVAITLVVIHHANSDLIPNLPTLEGGAGFIFWFIKNIGWSGVDLFFVLSGFLIGGLLFNELERCGGIDLRRFYASRGFKILPSYLLLLLVIGAAVYQRDPDAFAGSLSTFAYQLTFMQNYVNVTTGLEHWDLALGITWSLAVEEHFYILLPITLLSLSRYSPRSLMLSLLFIIVLVLIFRITNSLTADLDDDFKITHFRIDSLLVGVLLSYLYRNKSPIIEQVVAKRYLLIPLALILIASCHLWSRNDPLMFTLGFSLLGFAYAVLLILTLVKYNALLTQSVVAKLLAYVGQSSYNIYLWHCTWPLLFADDVHRVSSMIANQFANPVVVSLMLVAVYLLISIVIGIVLTKTVEASFLKLRRLAFGGSGTPGALPTTKIEPQPVGKAGPQRFVQE